MCLLVAEDSSRYLRPNSDSTELEDYGAPDLTIGRELNTLASNIAFGRNIAWMQFRSDAYAGMRLGEAVATEVLRDIKNTYVKGDFDGVLGEI